MKGWGTAFVAVALAMTACSTPQRRVRRHQALFDSYPPEVRQSILNGQVQVGFTAEQVTMALGAPSRVWSRRTPQEDQEIWSYGGGTNQQWQAVPAGGGYYTFVARNSGLCLGVPNASTANGIQLQVLTCNGSAAQNFRLAQQS